MDKNNSVFCTRLRQKMPALSDAPLNGAIGQTIQQNVSEEAWNEWVEAQIKIINEERLDLSEQPAQQRLYQQMVAFLGLGELLE
jgi:Fe-S cluster biosynthesis and repair protein YggX